MQGGGRSASPRNAYQERITQAQVSMEINKDKMNRKKEHFPFKKIRGSKGSWLKIKAGRGGNAYQERWISIQIRLTQINGDAYEKNSR